MNSRLCLFSLVLFCGTAQPVRTADEWGRRRSGIRRGMHEDETDLSNRKKYRRTPTQTMSERTKGSLFHSVCSGASPEHGLPNTSFAPRDRASPSFYSRTRRLHLASSKIPRPSNGSVPGSGTAVCATKLKAMVE